MFCVHNTLNTSGMKGLNRIPLRFWSHPQARESDYSTFRICWCSAGLPMLLPSQILPPFRITKKEKEKRSAFTWIRRNNKVRSQELLGFFNTCCMLCIRIQFRVFDPTTVPVPLPGWLIMAPSVYRISWIFTMKRCTKTFCFSIYFLFFIF